MYLLHEFGDHLVSVVLSHGGPLTSRSWSRNLHILAIEKSIKSTKKKYPSNLRKKGNNGMSLITCDVFFFFFFAN